MVEAPILLVEDDEDDRLLFEEALVDARVSRRVAHVSDGQATLDYLRREGIYFGLRDEPLPAIVLLDLNLPRVDGRTVLELMKSDPGLRSIPVVVLTTSRAPEDVSLCYDQGANSFITKPDVYEDLLGVIRKLDEYWFRTVRLPLTDDPMAGPNF